MAAAHVTVLLVEHTPTGSLRALSRAIGGAASWEGLEGVRLRAVPALEATAADVLAADGVVLLTPVNFGYISGALKHFFDSTFRELEHTTARLPFVAVIKGTTDATGAVRAIDAITTGMRWSRVVPHVVIEGDVGETEQSAAAEAAATLMASLL